MFESYFRGWELFEIVDPVGRAPGAGGDWVSGVGRSSGWWSDGSSARHFDPADEQTTNGGSSSADQGDDGPAGRPSWVVVGEVRRVAVELAGVEVPESAAVCLAEVEELVYARDRLISAIAARVGRVHGAGEARAHGHASTRTWLRGGCGMSSGSASSLVCLAMELARLPVVRARFAEGSLSEGQVAAICAATSGLSDEQAGVAEPILVGLADRATAGEVARAGRYLREVLDPGQADKESEADHGRRFLRVRPTGSGGLEGEFRLPREAAARLRALLDAYARPKVEGDERPLRVRNADAFMALLEQQISTELLVLVNAESLPDDHPVKTGRKTGNPQQEHEPATGDAPQTESAPESRAEPEPRLRPDDAPGPAPGEEREPGPSSGLRSDDAPGWAPGPDPGAEDEPVDEAAGWAGLGERVDRLVPGLLLATGQLLPVWE
ncbi:DUF222 domain-containing protein, partial [Planotetraspora phitsanulokensis]|uniref:DUF222 domain-containing protein n=1 Tax=Planotetraspora phitsanulokensis TaxID=575192 RepID=UPI00194ED099